MKIVTPRNFLEITIFFFFTNSKTQGSKMAARKETKMQAESGMEEYFIVGSNFGGGGTLTAKGSKKVVCVCVCVRVCVFVDSDASGTVAVRKCRLDCSKERKVFWRAHICKVAEARVHIFIFIFSFSYFPFFTDSVPWLSSNR